MRRGRLRSEDGAVPVEFALSVGLLVVPVALLVLTLPTWAERQTVARVAAGEAARAVVLAPDWSTGVADATAAVARIRSGADLRDGELNVVVCASVAGDPSCPAGPLRRDGVVTARVTLEVPVVVLPLVGEVGGFTVTASHTERVDRYRSLS